MTDVLDELASVLAARKSESPDTSYTASLYQKGLNKILEKVGEEATEVILAAKDLQSAEGEAKKNAEDAVLGELADLWFHCLVLTNHLNLSHSDVLSVLTDRMGVSGLEEKAARTGHNPPPGE